MAAVRAVAALLVVLAAAGAALADGDPRFIPARVASRVRPQTPGQGAAEELKRRSTLPDFTYEPLDWWSDWLRPIKPEAGKKQKTTICGETGDVDYKLPELLPAQTAAIKASWKMPTTLGEARVRFFLDSACTVFNESVNNVQWSETTTVLEAGTKYTYLELDDGGTTMWYPQ
ncbi:hypothetical protein Rsub_10685 [Raphidocelis subcapitata]|uniref:Uncharacterized protein n=1 Tax=Raphidocelis subcapitata TaxID=307507 RepID=A0A2V0PMA1_9CHLO|nr:hypothetical protein Rsub_10685 [Raphidocelis subcapitata]|eukprot:GBF98185.1 hypothetical protein Rsub_10685 [Raphidocelis subcapitata]